MLTLLEVPVTLPEGMRVHASMGSILHGALMERIPCELADALHESKMRPYSQSVVYDRDAGRVLWRIGSVESHVTDAIICALETGVMHLHQKGYDISLGEREVVQETTFEALADCAFGAGDAVRGADVTFRVPTSFKRAGQYILFPETGLILQNLLLRWNAFCPSIIIEEENIVEKLASHCSISRYQLRSAPFSLEGRTITGFAGTARLRFHGTDAMRRISGLLLSFAPFVGIGIKTALGMGAVDVVCME